MDGFHPGLDDARTRSDDGLGDATLAQFRRFLLTIGEWERDQNSTLDIADIVEATNDAIERFEELERENEELRAAVDSIQDLGSKKTTKEEKIAALVVYAQRQARDPRHSTVFISRHEMVGIMGVTRRYTYTLIDQDEGLPAEYGWIYNRKDTKQYGDLELDKDGMTPGIVLDLEELHDDPAGVNKFITKAAGVGVAD